ncbi:hypothetical protein [Pseudomonas aeruginosa]|uniref:hypothetical protein n=1 Tax=Pseudomonas aeruginosa TaxID=287 RepID=UPI003D7F666E
MDVIIISTILPEARSCRLLKNPLWKRRKFKAVIEWPHRMDLWEKWEELLLNSDDRGAAAWPSTKGAPPPCGGRRDHLLAGWAAPLQTHGEACPRWARRRSTAQNDPVQGERPFAACITFWVNRLARSGCSTARATRPG